MRLQKSIDLKMKAQQLKFIFFPFRVNNASTEINRLENELKPSNSNSKFFVPGLTMLVKKSTDLKMN